MQADHSPPGGEFVVVERDGGSSDATEDIGRASSDVKQRSGPAAQTTGAAHDLLSSAVAYYTRTACDAISQCRSDMHGSLLFDSLLALVLPGYTPDVYPPRVDSGQTLAHLVDLIAASDLDRIKRAALVFYLALDLDEQRWEEGRNGKGDENDSHQASAPAFARRAGIPKSVCSMMRGYWFLDHGNLLAAAPLLAEPDVALVPQILQTLSPLPFAAHSPKVASQRARSWSQFMSFARVHGQPISSPSPEETIVAACWTEGVWAAWKACRTLGSEQEWDACIGRILEHCFMPELRQSAIKDLVSVPLTPSEEAALAHNAVNPPPNVSLTPRAHAMAVDILLVRYINSGKHLEAVRLDERVSASTGLSGYAMEARNEAERDQLRKLRDRRDTLVRGALSVLTNMDRTLVNLGSNKGDQPSNLSSAEPHDMDQSWEKVAQKGKGSVDTTRTGVLDASLASPMAHTPVLRPVDAVLAAIASVSPLRRSSTTLSPLVRSGRATPFGRFASVQSTAADESVQDSPSIKAASHPVGMSDSPHASTSAARLPVTSRPYRLETSNVHAPDGEVISSTTPPTAEAQNGSMERSGDVSKGPYALLAEQLEAEIHSESVDAILQRSVSASPFHVQSSAKKNAHSTLVLKRPIRRYEARYEIGDPSRAAYHDEAQREETNDDAIKEPKSRRTRNKLPGAALSASRARGTNRKHRVSLPDQHGDDGDTSVPGSFPREAVDLEDDEAPLQAPAAASTSRRDKSNALTATSSKKRSARSGAAPAAEDEMEDAVPEMTQTPSLSLARSKSGPVRRSSARPGAAAAMSSTPLRRSARLSVEPEGVPEDGGEQPLSPETPIRRGGGGGSGGRGRVTRQRSASPTKPDKQARTTAASTPARRTRGASQAPTDDVIRANDDDADTAVNQQQGGGAAGIMTRSSSRRRGGAMPGGF